MATTPVSFDDLPEPVRAAVEARTGSIRNLLITDRAHRVDWGWATRGAAWLDAGYWAVWLIAAGGHLPGEAEAWEERIPAWRSEPADGVEVFAEANARIWEEIAEADPDPWTDRMVAAAQRWRDFRKGRS
ncbi:MAG: hypothetical protein QOF84_1746 [Streptomyces sp.]|jgi:hypothetical protein|nr:hypothetical protein [Streptomyces sp.]